MNELLAPSAASPDGTSTAPVSPAAPQPMRPSDDRRDGRRPSPLTAERVRELLDYDAETGLFRWRIGRSRLARPGVVAGSIKSGGYVVIGIDGQSHRAHRLAWLHMHGELPAGQIDHIDRVRTNNRLGNLRLATHSQNCQNARTPRTNTSGIRGVSIIRGTRFKARIWVRGRVFYLGTFSTSEEAARAYDAAALKHHGAFASLNFPRSGSPPFAGRGTVVIERADDGPCNPAMRLADAAPVIGTLPSVALARPKDECRDGRRSSPFTGGC